MITVEFLDKRCFIIFFAHGAYSGRGSRNWRCLSPRSLPPKTGGLYCDMLARIPRSAIASERMTSVACPIYLANEVTPRKQTGPLNAGPHLLLPHTEDSTPIDDAKLHKPASWYEFYREGLLRRKNPSSVKSVQRLAQQIRCMAALSRPLTAA